MECHRCFLDRDIVFTAVSRALQVEMMHIFTKSNFDMPEVKHPIYPGSSSGDLVGPINLESHCERLWHLTEDDKKKFYGTFRVAVGGATDTASQESAKRTQFKKAELQRQPAEGDESTLFEPFVYHGMPPDFYRDLFAVWSPRAIIDFTASDLTPAMVCLELKIPYLGICYTESHLVAGYKHLGELVYEAMLDEKSPLHDAKLCGLVKENGDKNQKAEKKQKKRKKNDKNEEGEVADMDQGQETPGDGEEANEPGADEKNDQKTETGKPPTKKAKPPANGAGGGPGGSSIDVLMNQLKTLRKQ